MIKHKIFLAFTLIELLVLAGWSRPGVMRPRPGPPASPGEDGAGAGAVP